LCVLRLSGPSWPISDPTFDDRFTLGIARHPIFIWPEHEHAGMALPHIGPTNNFCPHRKLTKKVAKQPKK
jgi:hypothetical protein